MVITWQRYMATGVTPAGLVVKRWMLRITRVRGTPKPSMYSTALVDSTINAVHRVEIRDVVQKMTLY